MINANHKQDGIRYVGGTVLTKRTVVIIERTDFLFYSGSINLIYTIQKNKRNHIFD